MASSDFIGRVREVTALAEEFATVRRGGSRPARCLMIRGRRRVGKTRLAEEFVGGLDAPSLFFTASNISATQELTNFADAVARSDLPDRHRYDDDVTTWDGALRQLGDLLPPDRPSVVVIDELPYLTARVDGLEGSLQAVWDRVISAKPVLLLLVGTDLPVMKGIDAPDRPFHQRGRPLFLEPLSPAEVQDMTQLPAAEAIEARLVTGGMPLLCREWRPESSLQDFLRTALSSPSTTLVSSGELMMAADLPTEAHPRTVLPAMALGGRKFTSIMRTSGLNRMTFNRSLELLTEKGSAAAERPLSTKLSRETRYRIADPYFGFWLRFVLPRLGEIERGRGEEVIPWILAGWPSWRAWAVEPLVRDGLRRMLSSNGTRWLRPGHANVVGGYWTRSNSVFVDLVAADREPVAKRIGCMGSISWHETDVIDPRRVSELAAARARTPGAAPDTPLVVASRVPGDVPGVDAVFSAEDLIAAWR